MKVSNTTLDLLLTSNHFCLFRPDECYKYFEGYAKQLENKFCPQNNSYNLNIKNDLKFDYRWASEINAGAAELSTFDFLSVNEGTIIRIFSLFYQLNSKYRTVELSGDSRVTRQINIDLLYSEELEQSNKIFTKVKITNNKLVNDVSEHMAMLAVKFIIAHEFGHLYNGHSSYYLEVKKKLESKTEQFDREQLFLDLQTMEMDADAFAVARVFEEIVNLLDDKKSVVRLLKEPNDIFVFAVYAICSVLSTSSFLDMKTYKYKTHPHPLVRLLLALDSFLLQISKISTNGTLEKKIDSEINGIIKLFAVSEGYSFEEYSDFILDNIEDFTMQYKKIMSNYWNRINKINKQSARMPIEGIDY